MVPPPHIALGGGISIETLEGYSSPIGKPSTLENDGTAGSVLHWSLRVVMDAGWTDPVAPSVYCIDPDTGHYITSGRLLTDITLPMVCELQTGIQPGTYTGTIYVDGAWTATQSIPISIHIIPLYTGYLKVSGSYVTSDGGHSGPDNQNIGLSHGAGSSPPVVMGLQFAIKKLTVDTDGIPAGTWVSQIADDLYWNDPSVPRWGSPTALTEITTFDSTTGCPSGTVVKDFTQGGFMPGPHEVTFTYTYTFGAP